MIRSQPILLGKMMLEERFVLFLVRAVDLSINIHFLPIALSQYIYSTDTSIT